MFLPSFICVYILSQIPGVPFPVSVSSPSTVIIEAPPRLLLRNNQYYEATFTGIEQLCTADPALCAIPEIQTQIKDLHSKKNLALTIGITGGALGLTAMIAGFFLLKKDFEDLGSNHTASTSLVWGGGGIVLSSILLANFLKPSRSDFLSLINNVNQFSPQNPLQIP